VKGCHENPVSRRHAPTYSPGMEIDLSTLGVFIAASLALYISPGPDMVYVASRAMGQGARAGVISALGISSGILVHMFAASFGLAALLKVWPAAFLIIKWAGIAYLVYLGLRALLSRAGTVTLQPTQTRRDDWRLYRQGFFCNILNPKIAIFFLAFLPQFTDAQHGNITLQMLFYGAVLAGGGLVWILFIAYAFGRAGNWFARHPGALRWQKWITGSSMLGLALFVALDEGA
jgi:threonine/homoserine/homoserine lactone efflux protein